MLRSMTLLLCISTLSACAWFNAPERAPADTTEMVAPAEEVEAAETLASDRPVAAEGDMCAGIAAIECEDGLVCILEDGACQLISDAAGTCAQKRPYCTREYRPVCGCDGKTYPNTCVAHSAGVSVGAQGPCAE